MLGAVHLTLIGLSGTNLMKSENIHAAGISTASNTEEKVITQKAVTDVKKVWTINFNSDVDINAIIGNVQVNEVNSGRVGAIVPVTVIPGTNSSVEINPPSGGYKKEQVYQITVKKGAKSKKGKNLYKNNIMKFTVTGQNTAVAKVEVSPVLSMFKSITINATTRPDITKYKIEGNDNLLNIGETSINVLDNKSSVQIYFYGTDGQTQLGKTTLNVNREINDTTLQIQ